MLTSLIVKQTPANDTSLPNGLVPLPDGWNKVDYLYSANVEKLILDLGTKNFTVLGVDDYWKTEIRLATKIKDLNDRLITVGPKEELTCNLNPFQIGNDLKSLYPGVSELEISCEFVTRLLEMRPSYSITKVLNWCNQISIITVSIFESPPDFVEANPSPTVPTLKKYRLFAPVEGLSLNFKLKFLNEDSKQIFNIPAKERQKVPTFGDFSSISDSNLKVKLNKDSMEYSDDGKFSQTVFLADTQSIAKSAVQFDVSFIEKIEIDAGDLRGRSLYPGLKNKQLKAYVKLFNQEKNYDIYDPELKSRIGISGDLFTWSTSGDLFSISQSGTISVPNNALLNSSSLFIPDFTNFVYDKENQAKQTVKLTLNANYTESRELTFSVLPNINWTKTIPAFSIKLNSLNDFNTKLNQVTNTLNDTKNTINIIKKVLPLLGLFESIQVGNVFAILFSDFIDLGISILRTNVYWAALNPLDSKALVEKGYMTQSSIESKELRAKKVLSSIASLTAFTKDNVVEPASEILASGTGLVKSVASSTFGALWKKEKERNLSPIFNAEAIKQWNKFVNSGVEFYMISEALPKNTTVNANILEIVNLLAYYGIGIEGSSRKLYFLVQNLNAGNYNDTFKKLRASNKSFIDKLDQFYDILANTESFLAESSGKTINRSETSYIEDKYTTTFKFLKAYPNLKGLEIINVDSLPEFHYAFDYKLRNTLPLPKENYTA